MSFSVLAGVFFSFTVKYSQDRYGRLTVIVCSKSMDSALFEEKARKIRKAML